MNTLTIISIAVLILGSLAVTYLVLDWQIEREEEEKKKEKKE